MLYTTGMNRTAVETIKERIPIEELIGSYVKLEKAGKSLKAKCPFHNEKTASFYVSPERGGYYCFGCGAKGDIFSFVEQFEGLDFRGALKVLAERAGVKLVQDTKAESERDQLLAVMEEAAAFFEAALAGADGAAARAYVKERGISDETRASFRIGWAPSGWRNLVDHLKGKGYSLGIIERAGLAKKNDDGAGNMYDRFRGRIMFPLFDSSGRVIAFSGRILVDDGKSAKYLNSPDTPLYDKSLVLYGLDKAKFDIRRLGYAIFVEGQMDLVLSHQAGIKNAVAASGTALADEAESASGVVSNLGLVRRLAPNVIIAFDSDAPGRKAAMRAAEIALSLGMDVKIADLVGGKDPADLVREDPELWRSALRSAKQVVEFALDGAVRDASDERKLLKALQERVYPLILTLPSRGDREHFVKMVRDRCGISREDVIWEDLRILSDRLEREGRSPNLPARGSVSADASPVAAARTGARLSGELPSRLDLVERRMFGLLALMERAKFPDALRFRERIAEAARGTFAERLAGIEAHHDDVLFEAESLFGADQPRWTVHMEELISNFEEDLINGEIMKSMQELRRAERAGDAAAVAELAAACHALSLRKAELSKRKAH